MYAESDRLHHPRLDWSVGKFQAHDRYRKSRYSLHTSDTQYAYVLSIIIIILLVLVVCDCVVTIIAGDD